MWFDEKVDIIIPTWNSMPEFEKCLQSIKSSIPEKNINTIIVVDKKSEDETISCAEQYGCKVVTDTGTLGSARLTGLRTAITKWIIFIDSDISISERWFKNMYYASIFLSTTKYKKFGWIYGRTIDDIEPLKSEKWFKMYSDFKGKPFRKIDERAYTHNTIALREPLLKAPIKFVNAWEDYLLAEEMRKAGYYVIEVYNDCVQHRDETYAKNGLYTEAWSQIGMINVYGINYKTLLRPFWFIYFGLKNTVYFSDIDHFVFNLKVFFSIINGCIHKNNFDEFKRKVKQ